MNKDELNVPVETGTHTADLDLSAKAFGSTEGASDDGLKVRHEASEKDVQQMKDGLSKVEKLEQRADHSRRAEMPEAFSLPMVGEAAAAYCAMSEAYREADRLRREWEKFAGRGEQKVEHDKHCAMMHPTEPVSFCDCGAKLAELQKQAMKVVRQMPHADAYDCGKDCARCRLEKVLDTPASPEPRPAPPPLEQK